MGKKEKAVEIFNNNYNCCQSVIGVFCEELGVDQETVFKLASSFGGGVARGDVCGAVSGALMALGLKYGHCIEGDMETKLKFKEMTYEFQNKFEDGYNSILCKEILGYDLTKEDELQIIKEKELFTSICPKVVECAVGIVEDML